MLNARRISERKRSGTATAVACATGRDSGGIRHMTQASGGATTEPRVGDETGEAFHPESRRVRSLIVLRRVADLPGGGTTC